MATFQDGLPHAKFEKCPKFLDSVIECEPLSWTV